MIRLAPLALLVACSAGENTACEVTFATEVHTVLSARWTSPRPGRSWAEYDLDGVIQSTPAVDDGDTAHEATLLGLLPLSEVGWTLITESGAHRYACSGASPTENLLPQTLGLEVLTWEPELVDPARYLLGSAFGMSPKPSVFIADRETGATRWYLEGDPGTQITTARLQGDQGHRALENGVTYNQADAERKADVGVVIGVSAAGERTESVRTPWAHHVFTTLSDGTFTYLALDARAWTDPVSHQSRMVAGDSLHEVAPDGTDTEIFTVWDWEPVEPSVLWENSLYPGYLDWTHANGLRWDEERGAYAVTFAGLEQVWLIGRDGVPQKRLGPGGDYPPDPQIPWSRPHDGSILADGSLLVYLGDHTDGATGCHQLRVDEETHTLVEEWRFLGDFGGYALGKCHRMSNGNTTIGYGSAGVVQEVTPDGQIAWEARTNQPSGLGTTRPFDDLYRP